MIDAREWVSGREGITNSYVEHQEPECCIVLVIPVAVIHAGLARRGPFFCFGCVALTNSDDAQRRYKSGRPLSGRLTVVIVDAVGRLT